LTAERAPAATARALAPLFAVQFFCWSGMFLMWVGTFPVITLAILDLPPGARGARLGMVTMAACFAWYATLAAALAFLIPRLLQQTSPAVLLAGATSIGAVGLAGLGLISGPWMLVPCFTAIAIGWCALANLPYTIAAQLVPGAEMEHWFRVFAFSSILPQLAVALLVIFLIGELDATAARRIMLAAGAAMLVGSGLSLALRARLG
jgi:maltose/moltooligosaccharide transporter